MIYLDNAATTKPEQSVIDSIVNLQSNYYFNASAIYKKGNDCSVSIKNVKKQVLNFISANSGDIIFTSSATEANNLAILGSYRKNFVNVCCGAGEHPSVYNTIKQLPNYYFLSLDNTGKIDVACFEKNLRKDTYFISVMLVSNETGAINDIKKLVEIKNKICPTAIFHCDAVQAFGKININVNNLGIDMLTFSSHKIGGLKGVGGLYVKNIKLLKPIVFGGGQENNLRSGTENVPAILSFGQLLQNLDIDANYKYVQNLKTKFLDIIMTNKNILINSNNDCSPYIISLMFADVKGETLVRMLDEQGVLVSTGSACSSKKEGNRNLELMGIDKALIPSSIRVSFSKNNTELEVEQAAKIMLDTYENLKIKLGVK